MRNTGLRVASSGKMDRDGVGLRCHPFCSFLFPRHRFKMLKSNWPPLAPQSCGAKSIEPAWGQLALFSPSAFSMGPSRGFPADCFFAPHSWERWPRKASCWNAQGPKTLPFVVVWLLPGCPCKTFMKMLLYLHRRLKIAVNSAKSRVPQECGTLRKCLWPSLLDGRSTAAAACPES